MECAILTTDGMTTGIGRGSSPSRENDSAVSARIQEIASEVLRLRLVQSQHRQLEGQLQAAVDKLRQLQSDKVLQLRSYLEHVLRLGLVPGTLGGQSGVGPESLCGLMECLCTVCDEQIISRRQEELLSTTRRLLQDPPALLDRLSQLPPANAFQSRRLAPFLLSCDGSWRGTLSDAGQCYEAIRSWLSCYYQFSLISNQIQATSEQLVQQEKLMEELARDVDAPPSTVMAPGTMCRPSVWRQYSGVRRSSSVQSTSSVGSRRSQSPAGDRGLGSQGLRPSPRTSASTLGRPTVRESPLKTSLSARNNLTDRVGRPGFNAPSTTTSSRAQASPGRSHSPSQLNTSSSRASLTARGPRDKAEVSPRPSRYGGPPSAAGALASARARIGTSNVSHSPHGSPRGAGYLEASRQAPLAPLARRQNVPAIRARRNPSQEKPVASARGPVVGSLGCVEEGVPTQPSPRSRAGGVGQSPLGAAIGGHVVMGPPLTMSRARTGQSPAAERASPDEPASTPPVSSRGASRAEAPGSGGSRLNSSRVSQASPSGRASACSSQPGTARAAPPQVQVPPRVSRLSSAGGYQPVGYQAVATAPLSAFAAAPLRRGQGSRSVLQTTIRRENTLVTAYGPTTMAVAAPPLAHVVAVGEVPAAINAAAAQTVTTAPQSPGGMQGELRQEWSLAASRSSPVLEVQQAGTIGGTTFVPAGGSRYTVGPTVTLRPLPLGFR